MILGCVNLSFFYKSDEKQIIALLLFLTLFLLIFSMINSVDAVDVSLDEVKKASQAVVEFDLDNGKIPSSGTVSGKKIDDEEFLHTAVRYTIRVSEGNTNNITIQSVGNPSSPQGSGSGTLTKAQYISLARNINVYFSENGKAPNYASSPIGNIRYESLVHAYARIMNYYRADGVLPDSMTFPIISGISSANVTVDQTPPTTSINIAGGDYSMPKTVILTANDNKDSNPTIYYSINGGSTISISKTVSISLNQGIHSISYRAKDNKGNYEAMKTAIFKIDLTTPSVSGNLGEGYYVINSTLILTANDNMDNNPTIYYKINNNIWIATQKTASIKLDQWINNISYYAKDNIGNTGPTTTNTYFTYDDKILKAANSVKSYVEANNTLPLNVLVGNHSISTSTFLKSLVEVVLTINNGSRLSNVSFTNILDSQFNQTENSINGIIYWDEYIAIANYIKNFIDTNGYCPSTVNTTLGSINFESLVYIYSNLLVTYDISTNSIVESVNFVPWMAVSNPNKFYNFNSQKIFIDLQSAIDDLNTSNSDIIYVGKGIFRGNFVVNKEITIKTLFGNSTLTALNPNQPVFSILSNFVEISSLNINGSTGTSAISISRFNNITISENNITNNIIGIDSIYSNNLLIFSNILTNNNLGINSIFGNDITICWNTINNNIQGISLSYIDTGVSIISNIITNNNLGIILDFSSGSVNFNAIFNNTLYGLESSFSNLNSTNNWWGSNTLTVSSNTGSHIYKFGGDVVHDSWLTLKTTIERDFTQSNITTGVYIVTGDLTYNNKGQDTSNEGNLPDDLAIKFSTTRGTINTTALTSRGRAKSALKIINDGLTNITSNSGNQNALYSSILNVSVSGVYNNRTNKYFTSIQSAVNDATTLTGDTILLANGIFAENIIINKKIVIKAINTGKVFISAFDFDKSIFTVNSAGSGSTIQGLVISEAYDAYGIFLNSASNCNIMNNSIYYNDYGIRLNGSKNNSISDNNIHNNNHGIYLANSANNSLSKNKISETENYAIYLENSTDNSIFLNNISTNFIGIYLEESLNNNISYNNFLEGSYGVYISKSSNIKIILSNFTDFWASIYFYNSNNNIIVNNNLNNGNYAICLYDSNVEIIENNFINNNENLININSTGIIMSPFTFECGPAVLATVLMKLGLNITLEEMIELTGVDVRGTSMYDIVQVAKEKGLISEGLNLSIDKLKENNIVYLEINDEGHFAIIINITNEIVCLADPTLGNINMSLENFTKFYSGKSIVITNNTNNSQLINATYLDDEVMQITIGRGREKYNWHIIASSKVYKKRTAHRFIRKWPFIQHRTVYYYTVYYKYREQDFPNYIPHHDVVYRFGPWINGF